MANCSLGGQSPKHVNFGSCALWRPTSSSQVIRAAEFEEKRNKIGIKESDLSINPLCFPVRQKFYCTYYSYLFKSDNSVGLH